MDANDFELQFAKWTKMTMFPIQKRTTELFSIQFSKRVIVKTVYCHKNVLLIRINLKLLYFDRFFANKKNDFSMICRIAVYFDIAFFFQPFSSIKSQNRNYPPNRSTFFQLYIRIL